MLDNDV